MAIGAGLYDQCSNREDQSTFFVYRPICVLRDPLRSHRKLHFSLCVHKDGGMSMSHASFTGTGGFTSRTQRMLALGLQKAAEQSSRQRLPNDAAALDVSSEEGSVDASPRQSATEFQSPGQ